MALKISQMVITPNIAKEMLEHNTNNRTIRKAYVNDLSRMMREGLWEEDSPNPIVFGDDGVLKDGQHRLTALINANATIKMLVIGCPSNIKHIDDGKSRTVVDIINIGNHTKINSAIASAIKLYLANHTSYRSILAVDVEREYMANADKWNDAFRISVKSGRPPLLRRGSGVLAIYNALCCGVSEDVLEAFALAVNTGFISSPKENAAILARNHLSNVDEVRRNVAWQTSGYIEDYIKLYVNKSERKMKLSKPTWYYTEKRKESNLWEYITN